jgi:putative transposase
MRLANSPCERRGILGMMVSTYAKVLAMPNRHDELKARVRADNAEHRGLYGYRRVTVAIRCHGRSVNHKTVQRLTGEMGMKSRAHPKESQSYKGELVRPLIIP